MAVSMGAFDPQLLARFTPLNQIHPQYHRQLSERIQLRQFRRGDTIIRKRDDNEYKHFLLRGRVEIRKSFDQRFNLKASQQQNFTALEEQLATQGSVRALEDCELMVVDTADIDYFLQWSSRDDYQIYHIEEGDTLLRDDILIDDEFQQDWDEAFFQTALARQLSVTAKQALCASLEDIEVRAGETIVRHNSSGDYFYIIKRGIAQVLTPPSGPFLGQCFDLGAGDYFGDEALVADTVRNASVTMQSDGLLGRLPREQFNELVKSALVQSLSQEEASAQEGTRLLDVRLPIEIRSRAANCLNIPVSVLRSQLAQLDPRCCYLITPDGGPRSELAAYLMRQAGFRAYCLN